jgi:hypothetical protein
MIKSLTALFLSAATLSSVAAESNNFDFGCHDVKSMIELMEEGPEDVVKQAADDPADYRDNTISGWTCAMTPLPPMRNGRIYLQSLDCFTDNGQKHVTDDDFATAGEIFKKNLGAFYDCFGKGLLTETPVSYTRTSRGEGIIGVLKNTYEGRHIIVQYGYFWDSTRPTPIIWQTIVGYGRE